jgi:hypothetical protein
VLSEHISNTVAKIIESVKPCSHRRRHSTLLIKLAVVQLSVISRICNQFASSMCGGRYYVMVFLVTRPLYATACVDWNQIKSLESCDLNAMCCAQPNRQYCLVILYVWEVTVVHKLVWIKLAKYCLILLNLYTTRTPNLSTQT